MTEQPYPLCQAKTRLGSDCRYIAAGDSGFCQMHGGDRERQVRLAEARGAMMARVMHKVLDQLGLSDEQHAAAESALPAAFRAETFSAEESQTPGELLLAALTRVVAEFEFLMGCAARAGMSQADIDRALGIPDVDHE